MRAIRRRFGLPYARRADRARDRGQWIDAALDFRRALDWMPWREDLKVQIGNCLKEFGDYRGAVSTYGSVRDGAHRPEALKQMADANQRAGYVILPFLTAENSGLVGGAATTAPLPPLSARHLPNRMRVEAEQPRRWLGSLGQIDTRAVRSKANNYPSILFDQVGALTIERDASLEPLFAGVVAIRARIVSPAVIDTVEISLGEGAARRVVATVVARPVDRSAALLRLSVVNAWIDAATLPPGRHWLSLTAGGGVPATGLFVTVALADGIAADLATSNAFIASPTPGSDVERTIVESPAMIRPAARGLFDRPIRRILAMRVDQLGDVSASLPALARLRALFPDAHLTVLVQPGVRGVVEASGIADRVVTVTLDYHEASERRHLAVEEEQRLRAMLAEDPADLAIDLNPGDETRPLLLLSGATYLVGFNADRFTFLDYGIGVRSRDKVNQLANLSHAAVVSTLVEGLGIAITPGRGAVPRRAPSEPALSTHGLAIRGYAVLHMGARHALNCWPAANFGELAARIVAETDLEVVLFADRGTDIVPGDRIRLLGMIDADTFDAILSNARVVVGNDSGPKHLAATRGVPTVSVHVDRLNWNEWGQDGPGSIVSKRVPCTGCGLNDIQLCGRDAVCIRSIDVETVWQAVRAML